MSAKIFIAGFKHESNTFSCLPTDLQAYQSRELHYGEEVVRAMSGTRTEVCAFLDACEQYAWEARPCIEANATPSGKVTREAYEHIRDTMLECLRNEGPFDGLLLSLHGAMVAAHEDDGEGLLLESIREVIGPQTPIAVTLDLHANVTDRMARLATIMVSYRTYPHIDGYETGAQAAALLKRTLAGEIRPRCVVARGQMLDAVDHGRTTAPGPMTEVLSSADALLAKPGILASSINAGFPWTDIHDTGPSAVLVCDGECPEAQSLAAGLIDEIWQSRHRSTVEILPVTQALKGARGGTDGAPLVLADFADNPGGGGYGDATQLLRALIESGIDNTAFATMYDPEVALACHSAGTGAEISVPLGNKVDPRIGEPLQVTGIVRNVNDGRFTYLGPMNAGTRLKPGPGAVLQVAGVEIVIMSARSQAYDLQHFLHAGIDPRKKSLLAVKSAHHFRAAFGPISREMRVVDAGGGITSRNFRDLHYERVRRPVYPLDLD